MATWYKHSFVF